MDSAQGCDLAPIFGDLSQIEKLSEIKPPLRDSLLNIEETILIFLMGQDYYLKVHKYSVVVCLGISDGFGSHLFFSTGKLSTYQQISKIPSEFFKIFDRNFGRKSSQLFYIHTYIS